ncbi:uncharacterized protein LOC133739715 [Rosa rugosa]|uniref:uncharacterized protein LOC133739715 n=1 Tax=Rosa rugosa TaxID=74645 RepID=UPI002B405EAC|nr:uncharacterized protein LOC133739715 [Rosa rugosa]XP_062023487.1 uncharacterized protein LOC133739715 [Rosa rugosa]
MSDVDWESLLRRTNDVELGAQNWEVVTGKHRISVIWVWSMLHNSLPPWFSVAPMMEWPDVHYRTLARLISKHVWLYSEMLAAETIVYQKDNLATVGPCNTPEPNAWNAVEKSKWSRNSFKLCGLMADKMRDMLPRVQA